jgi:hypothetical protein
MYKGSIFKPSNFVGGYKTSGGYDFLLRLVRQTPILKMEETIFSEALVHT